jgi:hypothetical protein
MMRVSINGDLTFLELLSKVRDAAVGAYAHQDAPLEKIAEAIYSNRRFNAVDPFQVVFNFVTFPSTTWDWPELRAIPLPVETKAT